ncbi:hypothetical protein L1049_001731 [Liquidambar formosana]|uniref:Uncharacterized protein n=1 Tax=Liquidambar formosana TaxID=63359 RepID=A0AAP0N368_LIQFO
MCWKKLFQMINDLPTVFEVVTGNIKQPKDQFATHNNSSKSKSSGKATNPYGMLARGGIDEGGWSYDSNKISWSPDMATPFTVVVHQWDFLVTLTATISYFIPSSTPPMNLYAVNSDS